LVVGLEVVDVLDVVEEVAGVVGVGLTDNTWLRL